MIDQNKRLNDVSELNIQSAEVFEIELCRTKVNKNSNRALV